MNAPAEDLVDEVLLAAEVVVDGRDVDVGTAGDLAQGRAREAELGEQFLGGAEDAVLGGEVCGGGHAGCLNQTLVWMLAASGERRQIGRRSPWKPDLQFR